MNTIYNLVLTSLFVLLCGTAGHAQELRITPSDYIDKAPKANVQIIGEQVQVSFDVNVPVNFIGRNEAYVVTPELRNGDWSQQLPALAIEGAHYNRVTSAKIFFKEKKYRDSTVYLDRIPYKGKEITVHYQTVVARTPETDSAELLLLENYRCDCYKREAVSHAAVEVIAPEAEPEVTPEAVEETVQEVVTEIAPEPQAPAVSQPERIAKQYTADFGNKSVFRQGSAEIDQEAFNAGYEKMRTEINAVIKNDNGEIDHVSIRTASSPEGPAAKNLELAQKRGEALRESVAKGLNVDPASISVDAQAENWDGFIEFVNQSKWNYKNEILDIIARNEDLDAREAALRKLPGFFYYNRIQQEFQKLRNCYVVVDYTVDAGMK